MREFRKTLKTYKALFEGTLTYFSQTTRQHIVLAYGPETVYYGKTAYATGFALRNIRDFPENYQPYDGY